MRPRPGWCLVNELAGDLQMKLLLYQLPMLPAGCTMCRARGCNHQFTNSLSLSPLFSIQLRLDDVASQPPITRLAHVLTAAFGCDLVAGQSDGSNYDGLASGQHQQPTPALLYIPPLLCTYLWPPLMPSKRFVRHSAQNCWAFHAIIAVPHRHSQRKPTLPFQLPAPHTNTNPLAQFARSTNFHKIFPPRGKALAQLRALLARILQFLSFFVSRERQTPLSELAPSTIPFSSTYPFPPLSLLFLLFGFVI